MTDDERAILEAFALTHALTLETHGEVGFCRPAVGFLRNNSYIDYNPYDDDYNQIAALYDDRLNPPPGVVDAYHKHHCMAVLVHDDNYDEALRQLVLWVNHYNVVGVSVTAYPMSQHSVGRLLGETESLALCIAP